MKSPADIAANAIARAVIAATAPERVIKTGFICLSCGEAYEADDSEPRFYTDQCEDCWDDKDGECYSRNRR